MTLVRTLIADDHAVVRTGLRVQLTASKRVEVVGTATDGQSLIDQFRLLRPDVVVTDIGMPRLNGIEAIGQILLIEPKARVLVLSAMEDIDTIAACINAGATGFASKDGGPEELLAAVLAVAQGHLSLDPSVAMSVLNRIKTGATQRANIGDLSPREREVLALVAKGKANKDIAVTLFIAASTVKTHLDRIYDKLGAPDRAAAVATAKDRGLI